MNVLRSVNFGIPRLSDDTRFLFKFGVGTSADFTINLDLFQTQLICPQKPP